MGSGRESFPSKQLVEMSPGVSLISGREGPSEDVPVPVKPDGPYWKRGTMERSAGTPRTPFSGLASGESLFPTSSPLPEEILPNSRRCGV